MIISPVQRSFTYQYRGLPLVDIILLPQKGGENVDSEEKNLDMADPYTDPEPQKPVVQVRKAKKRNVFLRLEE